MGSVVVVGSANVDLVYRVASLPAPGETVLATEATRHPGGKGNNQVIAAARAGAPAKFIASIGSDSGGDDLVTVLDDAGVTTLLRRPATETGTALITVDDHAENTIVVDSGANAELVGLHADELAAIEEAETLLVQLEIPMATVIAAARAARAARTKVVLNAAPFRPLTDELLRLIDVLVVNEVEAEALGPDARAVPLAWVITRGSHGALVSDGTGRETAVPAPAVRAVDTTGAGDTFCGALVAAMSEGRDLVEAARFAAVAGALATQRVGAVSSIPTRREIDEFVHDDGSKTARTS
ncbi:ribokinase [soil metagenome]